MVFDSSDTCLSPIQYMRINPKNFFNRKLDQLPLHFKNTVIRCNDFDVNRIEKWIYSNCTGRYSITKDIKTEGDSTRVCYVLGFEEPSDLMLFGLSGIAQNTQN